jgi:hypothetical protein
MGVDSLSAIETRRARDVYRAFRRLDRDKRRQVALRILRDQRVLADLYDHFLIDEALREGGRNTSWHAYRRQTGTLTG